MICILFNNLCLLCRIPKEEPEQVAALTYDPGDDDVSVADIQNPEDYEAIFKPKNTLGKLYIG